MNQRKRVLALAIGFALMGSCGAAIAHGTSSSTLCSQGKTHRWVPSGKGWGVQACRKPQSTSALASSAAVPTGNGINYNGGPVMLGTKDVYFIWYGNWSGNTASTILTTLAQNLGGSPYFNINTTYTDGSGNPIQNAITYSGSTTDNYSLGTQLSDANVASIVSNAISSGALPNDPNGVYFVMTSPDVNETSGFCTQYCGWHNNTTVGSSNIKYAFVGDPATQCASSCEPQQNQTTSPNQNPGADAMASIFSHELEEATTDPDGNAWYDSQGMENADKCAWHFGASAGNTYTTTDGATANMNLGGLDYLIQQNWVNAAGGY